MMMPVQRRAWFLVVLLALAALVQPATRTAARATTTSLVALHAPLRANALRAAEPERLPRAASHATPSVALPPTAPLAVLPAPSVALAPPSGVEPRPHAPPSPPPAARGPPPSA